MKIMTYTVTHIINPLVAHNWSYQLFSITHSDSRISSDGMYRLKVMDSSLLEIEKRSLISYLKRGGLI
jgi:hypothetical protein